MILAAERFVSRLGARAAHPPRWSLGSILVCAMGLALAACAPGTEADAPAPEAEAASAPPPAPPPPLTAAAHTKDANAAMGARLDLTDPADFADVERGWIASLETDAIRTAEGEIVWRVNAFDFVAGEAPDTVNPSLWRQAKLAARHGLFEVTDGVWQVRGYDLAVMTVIRGDTGWIVIDPLTTSETAAAAMSLVQQHLGERPVTGVLYTHSHVDHFGGVRGVIDEADARARGVPILAPAGFLEAAVTENLLAANPMARRAGLMFGVDLPRDAAGHVSSGLGPALARGTVGLIAPTEEVAERNARRVVDGVEFEFIDAAGTEAPSEFMFYLPQFKALCTAEVASGTMHNALTPRGAQVRDLLRWSEVLDHVLVHYGDAEVVFASHHWPKWGQQNVEAFLRGQRDIYRYIHDQSLRLANGGATPFEIAESLPEAPVQSRQFDTRGYYGTLNHNAKAVYQFYFGWWDGVPARYFAHPPEARAERFVTAMGGPERVLEAGAAAFEAGDYRWAAELFNELVFADPQNQPARDWLASAYEQIGFQAESGAWRSYYLAAARELRQGPPDQAAAALGNRDFLSGVTTPDLFDALAVRYAPGKAGAEPFLVSFVFPDRDEAMTVDVGESVAFPRQGASPEAAVTLTIDRADFDRLILAETAMPQLVGEGRVLIEGNPLKLQAFFGSLESPAPYFAIAEP